YYASVLSLYKVLKETVSPRAGFLAALSLACHRYFLAAIGWNYVDGFGISYLFLVMLALLWAARGHWRRTALAVAGAAAMSLVVANLSYTLFLLPLLVFPAVLNWQRRRASWAGSAACFALGAAGLFTCLAVVSWSLGGLFWILGPSLHMAS